MRIRRKEEVRSRAKSSAYYQRICGTNQKKQVLNPSKTIKFRAHCIILKTKTTRKWPCRWSAFSSPGLGYINLILGIYITRGASWALALVWQVNRTTRYHGSATSKPEMELAQMSVIRYWSARMENTVSIAFRFLLSHLSHDANGQCFWFLRDGIQKAIWYSSYRFLCKSVLIHPSSPNL